MINFFAKSGSSKKLFILKNFQRLKSKQQNEILEYVRKPLENHLLFIINDDFFKKTENLNKLEKLIGYVDVQTPLNYEMKKTLPNKKNEILGKIITQRL